MVMKNLSIVISICLLLVCSCNNGQKKAPKPETLYILTTTATYPNNVMNKVDAISEINTDYFECDLSLLTTGGYYGQKDITKPEVGVPFKAVFFQICNKDKTLITFVTTTEFLNFMSAHGYDLVTQIPNKYGGEYTFKRKK